MNIFPKKSSKRIFELTKTFEFEAAHFLPHHFGKCKNLHGHSYKLEITITGQKDPESGMIIDFGYMKSFVEDVIIEKLDHKDLNKELNFYPTAENMVEWIWDQLETSGFKITKVKLWETSGSAASLSLER